MTLDLSAKIIPCNSNSPFFIGSWSFPEDIERISKKHLCAYEILAGLNGITFQMFVNNLFIQDKRYLMEGFVKEPEGRVSFTCELKEKRISFRKEHHPHLRKIWRDINSTPYEGEETEHGLFVIRYRLKETSLLPEINAILLLRKVAGFNYN